jgi:lipopolysaccharide transport system ATP-binding protein
MKDIVIRVENLSKKYKVNALKHRHDTLRDQITEGVKSFVGRLRRPRLAARPARSKYNIWALKNISFEVNKGEVVGFIGRNGAGKSTLLKILSRITQPTQGFAELHGRVGSLLEVGTGFHAELTGRENIYLNGTILGMKKAEIDRKFDEIVAFSEVEKFIDTPVKRYSSGMYVRLAFSVAAHLDLQILLVDEVLAVGDVRFQGKCIDKMQIARKQGRTILFVSHNMETVTRLCERVIVLSNGVVAMDGSPKEAVSAYLNLETDSTAERIWADFDGAPGGEIVKLCSVRARAEEGKTADSFDIHEPISVEMEYQVLKPGYVLMPNYHFCNEENLHVFSAHDTDPNWRRRPRDPGRYVSTVSIPGNFLSDGTMRVTFGLTSLHPIIEDVFLVRDAIALKIIDSPGRLSARGEWTGPMGGVVRPLLDWNTQFAPSESTVALRQGARKEDLSYG